MTEYTCDSFRFFNLFPVYFGGKGTLVYAIYQFSFTSFQTARAMLVISSTLCRLASP